MPSGRCYWRTGGNVKAGEMRDQVVIQSVSTTYDTMGAPVETWSTLATVFAAVRPQRYTSGVEALVQAMGRETVATTYTVTVYWRDDVTELNRLTWNGKTLDINRVIDPDGKRTWLELMCEVVP